MLSWLFQPSKFKLTFNITKVSHKRYQEKWTLEEEKPFWNIAEIRYLALHSFGAVFRANPNFPISTFKQIHQTTEVVAIFSNFSSEKWCLFFGASPKRLGRSLEPCETSVDLQIHPGKKELAHQNGWKSSTIFGDRNFQALWNHHFSEDSENIQFFSEKQDLEENLDPLKVLFVLSI